MKKIVIIRIAVFLAVLLFVFIVGRKLIIDKRISLSKSPKFTLRSRPVEVAKAIKGTLKECYDYLAVIEPNQSTDISAQVTARIKKLYYREDDLVANGDILVKLDDQSTLDSISVLKAQMNQVQAELKANKVTLDSQKKTTSYWLGEMKRNKKLAENNAIPETQALAIIEKYNDAHGKELATKEQQSAILFKIETINREITQLETTLKYYTIRSPFKGVISNRSVDVGDLAVPGKYLYTIEDQSSIKLAFDVPQTDMPFLKIGQPITFDYNGTRYKTSITRIYPKLNNSMLLRIEAILDKKYISKIPLGAYVNASINFSTAKDQIILPEDSIVKNDNDKTFVYLVKNGQLSVVPVTITAAASGKVAVKGVNIGETVVTNSFLGWSQLSDGMKVEVKK